MTVTELREALQKLEADGHGALKVSYKSWYKDRHSEDEVGGAEVHVASKWDDYPLGTQFVRIT